MHLSLYRRFRPDSFEKMVRQEHIVRILKNQIEGNAIGHAYLFTGPRGTGKTTIARIFARAVNCEHPKDGSPCGQCPTCRALQEGSLDISEIDAASNNGVAEMRDLREKVQYPPVTGKYKVYIIDEVHMLTDAAFNALLKTLEEPPAHAIFILATTEPQKIPATILSRCMRLDFKLIPEEDLEKHLKIILDEIGKPYEEEAVAAIARAGAGSDRDMLSIAEACIVYADTLTYDAVCAVLGAADFHETAKLVSAMLTFDLETAIGCVERILSEGKSVGVLMKDILQLLSRITVAKTCNNAEKLLSLPKELYAEIKSIADRADGRAVLRATEILIKTESELRYVSSPRISLETAILRAAHPESDADSEALIVRINHLEEELKKGVKTASVAPMSEVRHAETPPAGEPPEDDFSFPEEEPIFEEAYFSDGPAPRSRKKAEAPAPQPAPQPVPAPQAARPSPQPAPQPAPPAAEAPQGEMSAEVAFGKFMRTLRKTPKSGVLFTMCSDLLATYEGETLVLTTESDTIFTALRRDDHRKAMEEIFSGMGVTAFEVRKKGAKPAMKSAIEELKNNFGDYPIEFK